MRCSLKFDRAGVTAFEDCSNYTWKPIFFFFLFFFFFNLFLGLRRAQRPPTTTIDDSPTMKTPGPSTWIQYNY